MGCLSTQPPDAVPPDAFPRVEDGWTSRLSVRLGPRMLQAALPLLMARSSPTASHYLRHLDRVYLQVYEPNGSASPAPLFAPPDDDVVLRLRDDDSTISLVRPAASAAPLNHFVLFISEDDEQIVAYAEGDMVQLIQHALASSF